MHSPTETGEQVDKLMQQLATLPDPRARQWGADAVRAILTLYGAGLERMLELVYEASPALIDTLAKDPLVGSLMLVHNLHPLGVEDRIEQALEGVRPYLKSHSGDVHLLGYTDGVVRLALVGTCNGCASSSVTMKLAVEKAINEAAPEVVRVEVDGVSDTPPDHQVPYGDWLNLSQAVEVASGAVIATRMGDADVVLCRLGDTLYAWSDVCPAGPHPLAGSHLAQAVLVCGTCGHKYDVRKAGQSLIAATMHLQPLPLRQEAEGVRVAVPAR